MSYKITAEDSLERLELIAIRYMALIGEALGHGTAYVGQEDLAIRLFDWIEHAVQDAFEGSQISRASFMMDNIARMTGIIERKPALLPPMGYRPELADLRALYAGCVRLGGQHRMLQNPFGQTFDVIVE